MDSEIDDMMPIQGREDLDAVIQAARDAMGGEFVGSAHIALICKDHPGGGLYVIYESGVLIVKCHGCGHRVSQIAVANEGRGMVVVGGMN